MPAPAVYILAVFGTVGAVLAFKEFVYEPHIAPAIDRWKFEFQAARRRREATAVHHSEPDLPMSQKGGPTKSNDDDDDSEDDTPSGHGKGSSPSSSNFMMNGILLRRTERDQKPKDVELENLVAREVTEFRDPATGQGLRQRRNVPEHAMDESIHAIPYTPLSPSRTHVLYDPSSPSTPGSGSRPLSPQSPPLTRSHPLSFDMGSGVDNPERQMKLASGPSTPALPTPISPPPQLSSSQIISYSTLFGNGPPPTPTPSTATSSPFNPLYTRSIPSLSQSYPQDLDSEHGLELLSPPSSRSGSPFSMAALSPNPGPGNDQALRALSPFGSISSQSASTFSSAVASPSPLGIGLGNESFDTLSPVSQPRAIVQTLSLPASNNASATSSARSTTYLSFDDADDSSNDNAEDMISRVMQPAPLYSSAPSTTGHSTSLLTNKYSGPGLIVPTGQTPTQESLFASRQSRTDAGNPFADHNVVSVATGAGAGEPSYFRPSSAATTSQTTALHHGNATGTLASQSDGELSDLDFMSDYAPSSASDLGNESDSNSSWSMPGSNAASPRMGAGGSLNPNPTADARRGRFGWR